MLMQHMSIMLLLLPAAAASSTQQIVLNKFDECRSDDHDATNMMMNISSLQSDLDVKRELDIEDHINNLMMLI